MTGHDDDLLTWFTQEMQAVPDQSSADAASPMGGVDGHGGDATGSHLDRHPAEQDVSGDLPLQPGDQR